MVLEILFEIEVLSNRYGTAGEADNRLKPMKQIIQVSGRIFVVGCILLIVRVIYLLGGFRGDMQHAAEMRGYIMLLVLPVVCCVAIWLSFQSLDCYLELHSLGHFYVRRLVSPGIITNAVRSLLAPTELYGSPEARLSKQLDLMSHIGCVPLSSIWTTEKSCKVSDRFLN